MKQKLSAFNPYGLPKNGIIFCWADTHLVFKPQEIIDQPFPRRFTPGKLWHKLYAVRFPQKIMTARKRLFNKIVAVFWQKIKEFSFGLAKNRPELVLFVHLGDRTVPGAGLKTSLKSLKQHQAVVSQLKKRLVNDYPAVKVAAKFLRGNHEEAHGRQIDVALGLKNQEEPFSQEIGKFNLVGLNTGLNSFNWRLQNLQKKVIQAANRSSLPIFVIGHQALRRLGLNQATIKISGHYHLPLKIKKPFSSAGYYFIAAPSANFPFGPRLPFVFWAIIINNDSYKVKKVVVN